MALPQFVRELIETKLSHYCKNKVPAHARKEVRVDFSIRGNSVTLFEQRPSFLDPITWTKNTRAQFRYNPATGYWTLYWPDRNDRWREYMDMDPTKNFEMIIEEVEADPIGIFWG